MLPKGHIIFGVLFSAIVYFVFNIGLLGFLIVLFSTVLIDFDHYLWYATKKNDFSLKKAYFWFKGKRSKYDLLKKDEKDKYKKILLIFHGIEFLIILILFSFINKIFIFIIMGISFHLFLDYIEMLYIKEPLFSKISQIWVIIYNKNKKDLFLLKKPL